MTKHKQLFDTIRNLLGRNLRQSDVDAINAALEGKAVPDTPSEAEHEEVPRRTSQVGLKLLHDWEGLARVRPAPDGRVEAYPDPGTGAEPWTIGYGSTRDGLHGFVRRDTVWTRQQCEERFADDLKLYERGVVQALGDAIANTSQAQFDALVSFHYNTGAIGRATLTRKHVAGDHEGAAREFQRWNKAKGRVLKGLVRRRAAEQKLYRSGM